MVNYNRRNYYRILRVQPDASPAVIRNNYRTLLQKLRLHPDLGGDDWNASLLNIAYNTLRQPQRRAEYDRELLQQYSLADLSGIHFDREASHPRPAATAGSEVNQRNYYRILHIQSDSPSAIIHSSYQILVGSEANSIPVDLVREAHDVLGNPLKRALYDRLLQQHHHADAARILKSTFTEATQEENVPMDNQEKFSGRANGTVHPTRPAAKGFQTYSPIISHYCAFCKTPHEYSEEYVRNSQCRVCESPLAPPSVTLSSGARRDNNRINQNGIVYYWEDWPSSRRSADLVDVSPTGLRLILDTQPEAGQVLKMIAADFKAVGEVSHCQPHNSRFNTGIRFLTILFNKQKGQFFQISI